MHLLSVNLSLNKRWHYKNKEIQKGQLKIILKLLFTLFYLNIAFCLPTPINNNGSFEKNTDGFYILRPSSNTAQEYEHAAIATSSHQCAKIGKKMLQKGGSAVDAAIATLLCDGVVSLQGMGIGGGFLMTIWDANQKKAYFLNAREYAPEAAYPEMFSINNKDDVFKGAKSIAIPGEIAGYWEAHQRFGNLPWKDLFEDVIEICEEGSNVSRYVANDIRKVQNDLNKSKFSALKNILVGSPNSEELVDIGDKIPRKKLAETLKKIRDNGAEIFYRGEIAENLVKDIQKAGGIITLDDFSNYKPEWKEPIKSTINDKIMYSAPTPGSGVILAFMLNVLEKLIPAPNEKIMWQRIVETFEWGYAKRNELGDFIERPEYSKKQYKDCKINSKDEATLKKSGYIFLEKEDGKWDKDCLMSVVSKILLSKEYAAQVRTFIKDDETSNDYFYYNVTKEGRIDRGTAHTSVYSADGCAVSVTSTINHILGSLTYSESTGIILNNQMDDYSYPGIKNGFGMEPSEFNFVRNGSSTLRPMSSMAPTIILNEDQSVRLVIGAAGGTKITTGITQGIIFNLLLDKDIRETVDHPRIHHNLWPMAVQVEPDFDQEIIEYLKSIGHDITGWLIMQNTMAAIQVYGPNHITASGDYRREGGTDGY